MAKPIMTRIPVIRWALAALAVVLLGVSACTSTSAGSPLPSNPAGGGPAVSSGPPTSSEDTEGKLAAIDPCTLLSAAQLDQYGLRKQSSGDVAGARTCGWGRGPDENGKGSFGVKPAIWDHQGIKDVNENGYSVTDLVIGTHQARQAKQISGNGCFVAVGVTNSSRVDVIVSADPGQSCGLANQFAKFIEPRLPGGGG